MKRAAKKVARKRLFAKPILAAGTVTVRGTGRALEVLVVHRAARADWSLPKGKLDSGELMPTCAVRETLEETTVETILRAPIGTIRYMSLGEPKLVRYWLAEPKDPAIAAGERDFASDWQPNPEIAEIHWVKPAKARKLLSYPHDVEILDKALELSVATRPLILLRHAEAEKRAAFAHRHDDNPPHDHERPLTEFGLSQTPAIAAALSAYGITEKFSSPAERCVSTIADVFVKRDEIHLLPEISEFGFMESAADAKIVSQELALNPAATVVVCHRPVLPAMVRSISRVLRIAEPSSKLKPGEFLVFHRPIKSSGRLRQGHVITEHSADHTQ